MAIRSPIWICLAAILTYCTDRYHLEMTMDRVAGIFDGKLTFFGIIIAIATFQLGWWRELSQRVETTLRQSARVEREEREGRMRDVAGAGVLAVSGLGSRLDRMRDLEHWRRRASEAREYMRQRVLPTNRALLTNALSARCWCQRAPTSPSSCSRLMCARCGWSPPLPLGPLGSLS